VLRKNVSGHYAAQFPHARGIVACDFLVAVTVRFQVLFVFLVMEVGSRRILH
jgi:putative transposase